MNSHSTPKIGLKTAIIIGMNAMIGSGIFTAPATMASYVGPAGIIAYCAVVLSVLFMALSLARLAELFPQEGSFYTYTRQWAGHTGGLIASGLYLVGLIVAMGLLTQIAGSYVSQLLPQFSSTACGMAILCLLVIFNLCGMVLSQMGQYILIALTLFPLATIIILCFLHTDLKNLTPFAPYGFGNILKATRVVIFGFFGFECATSLFSIVENPGKNVPRALVYSILIVGAIYTLFIASLIVSTPINLFGSPLTPLSNTLSHLFPGQTWLLQSIHLAILAALMGTIHSMIWSSSTLALSLLKKMSIRAISMSHHPRAHQYAVLIISACIFMPFYFLSDLHIFFNITATTIISAIILSLITLLTIKKEWASGRNCITLLGIGTACTILYFALEGLIEGLLSR